MPISDQTALVKRIKDELIAKGQTFASNCDAFQITGRVAWALRTQGAQLIVKTPGQNGCTWTNGVRYSHDAIAFSDGWVDCLEGAGPSLNTNKPSWQWHAAPTTGPLAAPFNFDGPDVPETHRYVGGGSDTGICDQCGRPRTDPVHAVLQSTVAHEYDGGEHDTGVCDICQKPKDDPIHTKGQGSSDALAPRLAALEARVRALEAAAVQYGGPIALRTADGHVICAEGGGGREINATRNVIGSWESFVVVKPQ